MDKFSCGLLRSDAIVVQNNRQPRVSSVHILLLLALAICCLVSENTYAGYASLVLFAIYLIEVLVNSPHQIIKYLPFYFAVCINIVGCAVCEYSDTYLTELQIKTSFVGSLPILIFCRVLFLEILQLYDSRFGVENFFESGNDSKYANKFNQLVSKLLLCVMLLLFIYVLPNPSFVLGIDRFQYASRLPDIFIKLFSWMSFLIVFPILAIKQTRSKAAFATVILYVLIAIWIGHKFGTLFNLLCIITLCFYDRLYLRGRNKLVRASFTVGIVLVSIVLGAVFLQGATSSASRTDYIYQRLAQQGQLWWKTYDLSEGKAHPEQIDIELSGLFASNTISENVGSRHGIYGVMYRTAPRNIIDNKISDGAQYTEAGYATAYYCAGALGSILFSIIMGIIAAFLCNACIRCMFIGRLLEAALIVRLISLTRTILGTAILSGLAAKLTILSLCFIALLWIMRQTTLKHLGRASSYAVKNYVPVLYSSMKALNVPVDEILLDCKHIDKNHSKSLINCDSIAFL